MRLYLSRSLKAVLLASLSLATTAGAAEFVVDGVNPDDIGHSSRFYDNGKGAYWTEMYSTPFKGAQELYDGPKNFSFLGELENRIVNPQGGVSVSSFANLTNDINTCWYNVSANVLQYWQSAYGVFYNGRDAEGAAKALPYGLNYDRENCRTLGGTQSLQLGTYFYDNFLNEGGDMASNAVSWYLCGDDLWSIGLMQEPHDTAGYFAEYFSSYWEDFEPPVIDKNSVSKHDRMGLGDISEYIKQAFGTELQKDGTYSEGTPGSLVYFGVSDAKIGGHALTCYGFKTGADGNITSVYLTNSDDREYQLMELFLKEKDGKVFLYTDEKCSDSDYWSFNRGNEWYVDQLAWIDTPDELKSMYAEYNSGDLVWTGSAEKWSQAAADNYDELPTASSGWKSAAKGKDYDSWYHMHRNTQFGDTATNTAVNMEGAIAAGKVTIDNCSKAYTFTGTEGTTLDTANLVKIGTEDAQFTKVAIRTSELTVATGKLRLGEDATLDINNQVVIKALDSNAASIYSTSGQQTYTLSNESIAITDADITYLSNENGMISNSLSHVTLTNNGTGTLSENNSNNKSGISANAAKGSINFLQKGASGVTLVEALIGTNLSLGVYAGDQPNETNDSLLTIQARLVGLTNASINANLTMMENAELDVSGTENTGINLDGALTFNAGMQLSEADKAAVLGMRSGDVYHLFNDVNSLTLSGSRYIDWTQAITEEDAVDANTYFTNLEKGMYYITFTGGANVGQVLLVSANVPEPATGTLSLLALATLAARRRRK